MSSAYALCMYQNTQQTLLDNAQQFYRETIREVGEKMIAQIKHDIADPYCTVESADECDLHPEVLARMHADSLPDAEQMVFLHGFAHDMNDGIQLDWYRGLEDELRAGITSNINREMYAILMYALEEVYADYLTRVPSPETTE